MTAFDTSATDIMGKETLIKSFQQQKCLNRARCSKSLNSVDATF